MMPVITSSGGPVTRNEVNRLFTIVVRTRGPFHNWPFSDIPGADEKQASLTLSQLMKSLRSQTGNMPLTIVIHGWGGKAARYFFDMLEASLLKDDAIWLLPLSKSEVETGIETSLPSGGEAQSDSALIDKAIPLNLEQPTDLRVYSNLVSDIVFFPASEDEEQARIAQFEQRARTVLIDSGGTLKESILQAGSAVVMCEWRGEKTLPVETDSSLAPQELEGAALDDGKVMDEIGNRLKERVEYYVHEFERRPYLRTDIKTMEEQYPELLKWSEGLIWQAHKHGWPDWAVECLPSLYVRVNRGPEEQATALVWHLALDCLPKTYAPRILEKLCDGQFFKVELTADAESFFETTAPIFEEHLSSFPYASERSYKAGAINNALQIIELWLRNNDLDAAEHVKELRKELLEQGKVVQRE